MRLVIRYKGVFGMRREERCPEVSEILCWRRLSETVGREYSSSYRHLQLHSTVPPALRACSATSLLQNSIALLCSSIDPSRPSSHPRKQPCMPQTESVHSLYMQNPISVMNGKDIETEAGLGSNSRFVGLATRGRERGGMIGGNGR